MSNKKTWLDNILPGILFQRSLITLDLFVWIRIKNINWGYFFKIPNSVVITTSVTTTISSNPENYGRVNILLRNVWGLIEVNDRIIEVNGIRAKKSNVEVSLTNSLQSSIWMHDLFAKIISFQQIQNVIVNIDNFNANRTVEMIF